MIWWISYAVMAFIVMSVLFLLCARGELREKKWRRSGQCDGISLGDVDPTMCMLCIMLGVVWPISLAIFLVYLFIRAWLEFIILPTVNKLDKRRVKLERTKNQ